MLTTNTTFSNWLAVFYRRVANRLAVFYRWVVKKKERTVGAEGGIVARVEATLTLTSANKPGETNEQVRRSIKHKGQSAPGTTTPRTDTKRERLKT